MQHPTPRCKRDPVYNLLLEIDSTWRYLISFMVDISGIPVFIIIINNVIKKFAFFLSARYATSQILPNL